MFYFPAPTPRKGQWFVVQFADEFVSLQACASDGALLATPRWNLELCRRQPSSVFIERTSTDDVRLPTRRWGTRVVEYLETSPAGRTYVQCRHKSRRHSFAIASLAASYKSQRHLICWRIAYHITLNEPLSSYSIL